MKLHNHAGEERDCILSLGAVLRALYQHGQTFANERALDNWLKEKGFAESKSLTSRIIADTNRVLSQCTCDSNYEPHACPYEKEINQNDDDRYCTCCPFCEDECELDV